MAQTGKGKPKHSHKNHEDKKRSNTTLRNTNPEVRDLHKDNTQTAKKIGKAIQAENGETIK